MDIGQQIVIILSVLLGVWYVVGAIINRRRGVATYQWIKGGLESLGKITEAKWIGTSGSGGRLIVDAGTKPFRRIEVVFLLDSREILPLWLVNLLRGKKDEMILKANLRRVPSTPFEIGSQGNKALKNLGASTGMTIQAFESVPDFAVVTREKGQEEKIITRIEQFLSQYGESIKSISLQRQAPHLILRAALPVLRNDPPEAFFEDVKKIIAPETGSDSETPDDNE